MSQTSYQTALPRDTVYNVWTFVSRFHNQGYELMLIEQGATRLLYPAIRSQ